MARVIEYYNDVIETDTNKRRNRAFYELFNYLKFNMPDGWSLIGFNIPEPSTVLQAHSLMFSVNNEFRIEFYTVTTAHATYFYQYRLYTRLYNIHGLELSSAFGRIAYSTVGTIGNIMCNIDINHYAGAYTEMIFDESPSLFKLYLDDVQAGAPSFLVTFNSDKFFNSLVNSTNDCRCTSYYNINNFASNAFVCDYTNVGNVVYIGKLRNCFVTRDTGNFIDIGGLPYKYVCRTQMGSSVYWCRIYVKYRL